MKTARIAVLGIALGAAGGAAMLAKSMIGQPAAPVEVAAPVGPAVELTEVLVLARNVDLGESLTQQDLRWQSWPREAVSRRYVTRDDSPSALEDFQGAVTRASFAEDEPVNEQKLIRSDRGGFMSAVLGEGKRAVAIRISEETGAGGFILPNDRVDVINTRSQSGPGVGGGDRFVSETILSNVRVLAIGQTMGEEDGKQVAIGGTATLELTVGQAEAVALAEREGELSLALRSLADAAPDAAAEEFGTSSTIRMLKFGVASQASTTR